MRRIIAALALAASLAPYAADAADRPAAASYSAPANLAAGARVGVATGRKSPFVGGDVVGPILLAAVAFGAGYLVGNAHHGRRYIFVPGGSVSPN